MKRLLYMRLIFVLLAITIIGALAKATPPQIEAFDQTMNRFSRDHIPLYESLLRDLRARLSKDGQTEAGERNLAVLTKYAENISADDVSGIQRAIQGGSDEALIVWLRRITTNLTGFRRTIDRLLVENLLTNKLRVDNSYIEQLKKYWDEEEYFSWRFSHEADQRTALLRAQKP